MQMRLPVPTKLEPLYIYRRVGDQRFVDIAGRVLLTGDSPPDGYEFVEIGKFLNSSVEYEIYKLISPEERNE